MQIDYAGITNIKITSSSRNDEGDPHEEGGAEGSQARSGAYRFLLDCVAQFFTDLLDSNIEQLAPGSKKRKIRLTTKWCPTPGSLFSRTTLLCEAIAHRLFLCNSSPDYTDLTEEHYEYHLLHLRGEVLVPLREVMELPEVYMSAQ